MLQPVPRRIVGSGRRVDFKQSRQSLAGQLARRVVGVGREVRAVGERPAIRRCVVGERVTIGVGSVAAFR